MQRRVYVPLQHVRQPPPAAAAAARGASAVPVNQPRPGVLPVEPHQRVQEVIDDCTKESEVAWCQCAYKAQRTYRCEHQRQVDWL